MLQAGPNRHEYICESLELFGKQVIPCFADGREDREREKAERLAPVIEAALARREPPRRQARPYRIDETAELARVAGRRPQRGRDVRRSLAVLTNPIRPDPDLSTVHASTASRS